MNTKIFCDIADINQIRKFSRKKIVKSRLVTQFEEVFPQIKKDFFLDISLNQLVGEKVVAYYFFSLYCEL